MNIKEKTDILICECHSTEHQIVIHYSEDKSKNGKIYPMCYLHVHLNKRPFWGRVKYGIKYIFGYQCKYGAFDEFIFNPKDSKKLNKLVKFLKDK
jgi:hypothetical protein